MVKKREIEIPIADMGKFKSARIEGGKAFAEIFVNKKGKLDELASYKMDYYKQLHPNIAIKKKESFLSKILKAPFRLIWWLLKNSLNIITFGLYAKMMIDEDKK